MSKTIKMMCIAAAMAVALLLGKYLVTPLLMKDANYGMQRAISEHNIDNLFVGSSMFAQGIDTRQVFADESSFNLCFNGNQPWQEYVEVKELLDKGVEIHTVFIDMYSGTICQDAKFSDVRSIQGVTFDYSNRLFKEYDKIANLSLKDLYEWFVTANNEFFFTYPILFKITNNRFCLGNNVAYKQGKTVEDLDGIVAINDGSVMSINNVQLDYMIKIVEMCREKGIRVVLVETPKYESLGSENVDYNRVMKKYIDSMVNYECKIICNESTCDDTYNEKIINYAYDNSNATYFIDTIHLSTKGCKEFSGKLAEIVKIKRRDFEK